MINYPVSFAKVDATNVFAFLERAKKRVIWAKPAFTKLEISYLLELKNERDLKIDVFLENSEKAYRHAFGEVESIDLLQENKDKIGIQLADRIRLAIAIVDDHAVVYAPNLSFMEKESETNSFPNGIFCDEVITKDLLKQFVGSTSDSEESATNSVVESDMDTDSIKVLELQDEKPQNVLATNIIIFPGCKEVFEEKVENVSDELNKMRVALENDPPVNPEKLRKINLYRNKYKLFKRQVNGVRIQNKSINIKPIYSLFPNADERLKSSWTVFNKEDVKKLEDMKLFDQELEKIMNEHNVMDAGRFGFIIEKKSKNKFQDDTLKLVTLFKSFLGNNPSEEANERFAKKVEDQITKLTNKDSQNTASVVSLKSVLNDSRSKLETYLYVQWPKEDKKLFEDMLKKHRYIATKNSNERSTEELFYDEALKTKMIKELVSCIVVEELKFTQANEIIESIDVKLDFMDISDELIFDNEDFQKYLQKYSLDVRDYSEGFEEIEITT